MFALLRFYAFNNDGGAVGTHAELHEFLVRNRAEWHTLLLQARDQAVGSRRDFWQMMKDWGVTSAIGGWLVHHGTSENAKLAHEYTSSEWGEENQGLVDSLRSQCFEVHHAIGRKAAHGYK